VLSTVDSTMHKTQCAVYSR